MRRLLWIHQNFVAPGQAGNERGMFAVGGLLDSGWRIKLVTPSNSYQHDRGGDAKTDVVQDGDLEHHRIALRATGPKARARSYLEFSWKALASALTGERPDLVFSTTPPITQTLVSLIVAMYRRVPIVLEVRDLWPLFLEETGLVRSRFMLAILRRIEILAYRSASVIVSVSPAYVPYLEAMGVDTKAIVLAPHGAQWRDIDELGRKGASFRQSRGVVGRPIILYAGSLQEHYAVATWLSAFEQVQRRRSDAVLVVAGGGRAAHVIEAAASRNPGIIYLGPVPRNELSGPIGAADIGLVCLSDAPSFSSVLPGKLVDLMSCAVPVVSNIGGQTARIIRSSGAGWSSTSNSSNDLAEALESALASPEKERRQRGLEGRAFVLQYMSAAQQAAAISRACSNALNRERTRSGGSWWRLFATGHDRVRLLFQDERADVAGKAFDRWIAAHDQAAPVSADEI